MNAYEEIKTLGRGAFAVVMLVRRKTDKEKFVIKRLFTPMSELTPKERTEVAQEVKLLAHLSHVNVVKFYDNFVDNGVMHILMEFATGGTLYKQIVNREGALFEEGQIWEFFVQIVMALKYVHSCNVLHRDLKSQNIMLSGPQQRTIKLGDFGIAKVLSSGHDMAATVVGTPHYLSPEVVHGKPYDNKSDIWALGCVLYEMCALCKPFDASNIPGIIMKIVRANPRPIDASYSTDLKNMVSLLLRPSPEERPSAEEIEAMPIVRAHIQKWKLTCKRLRAPLPMGEGGGLGGAGLMTPMSRRNVPSMFQEGILHGGPKDDDEAPVKAVPTMTPAQQTAATEAAVVDQLQKLRSKADNTASAAGNRAAIQTKLLQIQEQLTSSPSPSLISGRVWENVGVLWAESGNFIRAIGAYRRALRCKSATASLGAMEQLGNLTVRFALQVWQGVRGGSEHLVMAEICHVGEPAMLLGSDAPEEVATAINTLHLNPGLLTAPRRRSSSVEDTALDADTTSYEPYALADGEPLWRRIASQLMTEGLELLERMCKFGETVERRSLLGSAYKRRAWAGLGDSRKQDLTAAANAYMLAHNLELLELHGESPSPYALLNQLTLEMLAGSGAADERSRILAMTATAGAWAKEKQIISPTDVWLWVQGVDAMCLQYLLDEGSITEQNVVDAYKEQFAFGASQRVKSSVLDQFGFMQDVLDGRLEEESVEAMRLEKEAVEGGLHGPGPVTGVGTAVVVPSSESPPAPESLALARGPVSSTGPPNAVVAWLLSVVTKLTNLRMKLQDDAGPTPVSPRALESAETVPGTVPGPAPAPVALAAASSVGSVPGTPSGGPEVPGKGLTRSGSFTGKPMAFSTARRPTLDGRGLHGLDVPATPKLNHSTFISNVANLPQQAPPAATHSPATASMPTVPSLAASAGYTSSPLYAMATGSELPVISEHSAREDDSPDTTSHRRPKPHATARGVESKGSSSIMRVVMVAPTSPTSSFNGSSGNYVVADVGQDTSIGRRRGDSSENVSEGSFNSSAGTAVAVAAATVTQPTAPAPNPFARSSGRRAHNAPIAAVGASSGSGSGSGGGASTDSTAPAASGRTGTTGAVPAGGVAGPRIAGGPRVAKPALPEAQTASTSGTVSVPPTSSSTQLSLEAAKSPPSGALNPFSRAAGLRRHTNFSNSTSSVATADQDSTRSLLGQVSPSLASPGAARQGSGLGLRGTPGSSSHLTKAAEVPEAAPKPDNPFSRSAGIRAHRDLPSAQRVPSTGGGGSAPSSVVLPALQGTGTAPGRSRAGPPDVTPLPPRRPSRPSVEAPGGPPGPAKAPSPHVVLPGGVPGGSTPTQSGVTASTPPAGAGFLPAVSRSGSKTPSGRPGALDGGASSSPVRRGASDSHLPQVNGASGLASGAAVPGDITVTPATKSVFGKRTRVQPMGDVDESRQQSSTCAVL